VTPQIATGDQAGSTTLSNAANPVDVSIGDKSAPVAFAGLAPGFVELKRLHYLRGRYTTPALQSASIKHPSNSKTC
jgi:hypothetical protein